MTEAGIGQPAALASASAFGVPILNGLIIRQHISCRLDDDAIDTILGIISVRFGRQRAFLKAEIPTKSN